MPIRQDIASNRTTFNEQANKTPEKRNKEEERHYKFLEAKQAKGLMDFEIELIKAALGGNQVKMENAVISYTTTTLDAIIAGKMGATKPKPTPPKKPEPSEPTNPNPTIPPIIKPSEQDPTRITDTDTGGQLTLRQVMIAKQISNQDFELLVAHFGNEFEAESAVMDMSKWRLGEIIAKQRRVESDEKRLRISSFDTNTQDILWREEQNALVYEDIKNEWTPNSGVLGAGRRAYAEDVMSEWNEFTEGKYPIPDLTTFDEFEVYGDSGNISDLQVQIKNIIEGALVGESLGLAAIGTYTAIAEQLPPPKVINAVNKITGFVGAAIANIYGESNFSSGPVDKMGIRVKDGNEYTSYDAVKYTAGMDIATTEQRPFLKDKYVDTQSFPYDSYDEE